MIKNRAWAFIVVVLAVSWVVQFVLFKGIVSEKYLTLYMFVPALIALIFFLFDKNPIKTQLALFTRRTSLWSWLFALLYPFFWLGLVVVVALITGLGKLNSSALLNWGNPSFLLGFISMILVMSPIVFGEEYGWRGYLLPKLADRRSLLQATIITGLVWGLWHIPSYYILYSQANIGNPFLLTALGVITVAIGAFPYTYLFFSSGNILPCVLFHAVYDQLAARVFLSSTGSTAPSAEATGLLLIPWPYALVILSFVGAVMAGYFTLKFKGLAQHYSDQIIKER